MSTVLDGHPAAFRRAFEEAPIGMALVSVHGPDRGRFLRVNAAMAALTGYSESELLGVEFQRITHPDDVASDLALMDRMLSGEISRYELEKRYTHAEGHAVWVLVTATLAFDSGERPLYAIRQVQNIVARKEVEGQLEYLADHDPLTGLYNRRRFNRELTHQLEFVQRYGGSGALLSIDLDHLKLVNDTYGHAAGDEYIGACARILGTRSRSTDIVGRLGGDEFALTLPHADKAQAETWAREFLGSLRDDRGVQPSPLPPLSASIGIVAFNERPGTSAGDLQICADLAMYGAKAAGGNRVALYTPELERGPVGGAGPSRAPRLSWSARIRTALNAGDFVLYAQPIIDLATNEIKQHELLLRLPLASGEVILPGAFLYTAERFGLICELDRWVIAQALHYAAAHRGHPVAINLAADTVCDPELTSFITTELARTGADAHDLIFEITETAAISNVAGAQRSLTQLIALGARTALDDFGAGFGSFHHLKQLPLDIVKIDGEFIRNLVASRRDQTIVRSMVDLAHGLGQLATAEHIENEPTLDLVRDLGVDLAQGNFIGSAQPIANTDHAATPDHPTNFSHRRERVI